MANAGLIIRSESLGLGIDLFAKDPEGVYSDLSCDGFRRILSMIRAGQINALLFTHEHPDHFNAGMAAEAVRAAKESGRTLRIITTPAAAQMLTAEGISSSDITVVPDQAYEASFELDDGCRISAFYAVHDGAVYRSVRNLVFLISWNGRRIIIPGDAKPEAQLFETISGWSREADWMFAPFPYLAKRSVRKLICGNLTIRNPVLVHFPIPERDAQKWTQNALKACAEARDELPKPLYLQTQGERVLL